VLNCFATVLFLRKFFPQNYLPIISSRSDRFFCAKLSITKDIPTKKNGIVGYPYLGAVAKIADEAGTAHARLVAPKVMRTGKRFAALGALKRLVQGGNIVGVLLEVPVLRIHDNLVWIRIRMRILLFSSLTFKMPTKNKKKFSCVLLFEGTFTSFFKEKS
jgi:hypothetical protein